MGHCGSLRSLAGYRPASGSEPDLARAGIGEQGGLGLVAAVPVGNTTINVNSILPAPSGRKWRSRLVAGTECVYFVHVLIDRQLRSDVSIERPIAVI